MLYVFNKDTIITGGYWGMMYKTENGGLNWIKINIGTNGFLYGMSFLNSIIGYLVSETGLFKTTNSGYSWSALPVFPGISKSDICFPDQNTGYIVGQKLIKTTNSGASWDTLSITKFPGQKIHFINNQTGFIGGNNYIFRTTTGGINWDTVLTGAALIQQIDFINSSTGWASTNMYFYKTTDVGATWFNLNVTNGAAAFNFLNTQTGYLCNYSSIISKTTNGGNNCQLLEIL
jgi:photosystem II stability/assembly factor-like uncharacterized protein